MGFVRLQIKQLLAEETRTGKQVIKKKQTTKFK